MQDRFLIGKIFKGNEVAYGVFRPANEKDERGKEQGGQGWGHTEQLSTDTEVWKGHLEGTQSIGTVPVDHEGECHWGCIDIDTYKNFNHVHLIKSIVVNLGFCLHAHAGAKPARSRPRAGPTPKNALRWATDPDLP